MLPFFAQRVESAHAQHALYNMHLEQITGALASNRNLSKDLWLTISKKASAQTMISLTFNYHIDDQMLAVLLSDKRKTVRSNIFNAGLRNCSSKMARRLLEHPDFTQKEARAWLDNIYPGSKLNPDLIRKIVIKANTNATANLWIKEKNVFTTYQAQKYLREIFNSLNYPHILEIIDYRPDLIPFFMKKARHKGSNVIYEALAASQHLTNANYMLKIVDSVQAKVAKTTYSYLSPTTINPVLLLLQNPNLTPAVRVKILNLITPQLPRLKQAHAWSRFEPIYQQALKEIKLRPVKTNWEKAQGEDRVRIAKAMIAYQVDSWHDKNPTLVDLYQSELQDQETTGNQTQPPSNNQAYFQNQAYIHAMAIDFAMRGQWDRCDQQVLKRFVAPVLDPYGSLAWQTFFSLATTWKSDLKELIDTTITLSENS